MGNQQLDEIRERLREFAKARDWDQFHSPKNLAAALAVEAGELLEHFQWLREDESRCLGAEAHKAVGLEMADVLLYLVRLADKIDIDLYAVAYQKLLVNEAKYPAALARGSARKSKDL